MNHCYYYGTVKTKHFDAPQLTCGGDTSQFGLSLSDPLTDAVEEEKKKTQVVASLCLAPSTVRAHSACKATISSDVQYYSQRLSPSKHPYSRD